MVAHARTRKCQLTHYLCMCMCVWMHVAGVGILRWTKVALERQQLSLPKHPHVCTAVVAAAEVIPLQLIACARKHSDARHIFIRMRASLAYLPSSGCFFLAAANLFSNLSHCALHWKCLWTQQFTWVGRWVKWLVGRYDGSSNSTSMLLFLPQLIQVFVPHACVYMDFHILGLSA